MRTFAPRRDDFLGMLVMPHFPPTISVERHAVLNTGRFPRITFASLHRGELIEQATNGAPGLNGIVEDAGGLLIRFVGAGIGYFAGSMSHVPGAPLIGAGVGYLLGAGFSKLAGGE